MLNLVFKEYLGFLKDKGIEVAEYNLKEGYYWLDNQIIKAYDKQGNIHKILRLLVDDKLNISIKTIYKNKPFEIESWEETLMRNEGRLLELETESKLLIKETIKKYNNFTPRILSSGGKDSSVTTFLVREVAPSSQIIFNNTSLDCGDTYLHIKKQDDVMIINPKEGFYQWRERLNFVPTRISRACCSKFKEGAMVDVLDKSEKNLFFMGMRNQESNTRSGYVDEWKNDKWGNRKWQGVLPIRKWSEEDIWLYILWKNISINYKYKKGYSRVGCAAACPYYSKTIWALDKYWYPKMYNRWQLILDNDFDKNNKAIIMNCTKEEYKLKAWNGGVYRKEPTEDVINEFAEKNNLTVDVAKKYFNHTCEECDKKIKSKEVLAMNMKWFGRNINKFYCKKHLKQKLSQSNNSEFTEDNWKEYAQRFKGQGCDLF